MTLPLDFDIFLRSGSVTNPEIAVWLHGSDAVLELRSKHRREEPCTDDVVCLRTQVHREHAREQIRVAEPICRDLRCQRRGRPRVHDVGIPGEPVGLIALVGDDTRLVCRSRDPSAAAIQRARSGGRNRSDRWRRSDTTPGTDTEESLPADAPVAGESIDPVLVAMAHELGMPLQFGAARQQLLPKLHRLDEPLPAGHDLERAITLLVELDRVRDRARLADEIARLLEELHDPCARLRRRQVRQLIVGSLSRRGIARFPARRSPRHRTEGTVRLNDGSHRQFEFAPPRDVCDVAEGTIIAMPLPFSGSASGWALTGTGTLNRGVHDLGSKQWLIARVVGVSDEGDACRNQFRSGRIDLDEGQVGSREPDAMIGSGLFAYSSSA